MEKKESKESKNNKKEELKKSDSSVEKALKQGNEEVLAKAIQDLLKRN